MKLNIVPFVLPIGGSRLVRSCHLPSIGIRASWCAAVGLFCVLSALQAWSADCVSPPAGLVAWWPGEGNAYDEAGTNNGVLEGGVAFAAGEVSQAFSFNGIGQQVRVQASASLNVGLADGFTIECWIKPADVNSWHPLVEWNNGSTFGTGFWIYNNPGATYINIIDTNGASHALGSPVNILNTTSFQHVAAAYDHASGVVTLYCNGVAVATTTFGNFTPQTSYDLFLGRRPAGPGIPPTAQYDGLMDEVSLYSRALSASEIQAIYNAGSLGKCGWPTIMRHPRNQVGYWGKSVSFTVAAVGAPPLSYQWQKDTAPIAGATGSSLVLTNLQMTDAGNYSVVVSNSIGSATSSNAYLTMNPAGVSLALYSGIMIDGVVGLTYGIQYTTDLSNTNNWAGVTNITLTVPTQLWYESQPASQPRRYYRVVPGPISVP